MSKSKTKYKIILESSGIQKDWSALKDEFPERMEELNSFLKNNPADRRKALGRLKKLKGRFQGILQYDVTQDDARVWYKVDKREHHVIIKRAGHHPNW